MSGLHGRPERSWVRRCPDCGKHGYTSRKEARRAARALYPNDALRAYQCGPWWHIGHTAAWRKRGEGISE